MGADVPKVPIVLGLVAAALFALLLAIQPGVLGLSGSQTSDNQAYVPPGGYPPIPTHFPACFEGNMSTGVWTEVPCQANPNIPATQVPLHNSTR